MIVEPWADRGFFSTDGLRVFVLGESSFCSNQDGPCGNRGDPIRPNWNGQIIESFLDKKNDRKMGDDRTIKRAMDVFYDSPPVSREGHHQFWQHTAFANFIQTDMGKPGTRKKHEDWLGGQQAFPKYLRHLQPQFVLAVGFELWDNLPVHDRREHDFGVEPPKGRTGITRPCLLYPTANGHHALVCGIRHTSRGFNHGVWRAWVRAAFEEATRLHGLE